MWLGGGKSVPAGEVGFNPLEKAGHPLHTLAWRTHGQRGVASNSPQDRKRVDVAQWLNDSIHQIVSSYLISLLD